MNTLMYEHPLTAQHIRVVKEIVKYHVVGPIGKGLACGDVGMRSVNALGDPSFTSYCVRCRSRRDDRVERHCQNRRRKDAATTEIVIFTLIEPTRIPGRQKLIGTIIEQVKMRYVFITVSRTPCSIFTTKKRNKILATQLSGVPLLLGISNNLTPFISKTDPLPT